MNRRAFVVLAAVTAVFIVLAAFATGRGNRAIVSVTPGERVFPGLGPHLADLAWMRVTRGPMKLDFARIGNGWFVVEKGNYPAAPGKVQQALLALADLRLVEPKTARPELYSRLEVGDPAEGKSTLVEVKDKTGATVAQLIVGKRRYDRLGAGEDGVYVRRPGEAQAWLARGTLDLAGDPPAWIDRHIVDIPDGRIETVVLTGPDGTALTLSRAAAGGEFKVQSPPADTKFKGATVLAEPANALQTLDFDDVRPAAELPVPDSGVANAVFTTFDGLNVHLRLFDRDKVSWVAVDASPSDSSKPDPKIAAEAKQIDEKVLPWTYAIPAFKATMLRTKLADLIEPPNKGS